ncbi:MAG: hypothetical protein HY675_09710, partial [Chloroflexi bacterium]|nr:hypothetical protein [Chloroflexota bacterium]
MPVKIHCPNPVCGKTANVSEEFVGKFVRCKHCRHKFKVPHLSDGTQQPASPRSTAERAKET